MLDNYPLLFVEENRLYCYLVCQNIFSFFWFQTLNIYEI